jgi:hypothetical protein
MLAGLACCDMNDEGKAFAERGLSLNNMARTIYRGASATNLILFIPLLIR